MKNSKGLRRGREEREPTEQALCAITQPASLFFKISWKRMSHLNIAGNQIEVEGKNDFGQSFSLKCLHSNLCLEKKRRCLNLDERWGTVNNAGSLGVGPWCAQAGAFILTLTTTVWPRVSQALPCLPAAGAGLIGRQRDCNRACQLCAYNMGRESSNR